MKPAPFWRTDRLAGVLAVLVALAIGLFTDWIGTLERRFYDFASTALPRQPSERLAAIAIDDRSMAPIGRWPWPLEAPVALIAQPPWPGWDDGRAGAKLADEKTTVFEKTVIAASTMAMNAMADEGRPHHES